MGGQSLWVISGPQRRAHLSAADIEVQLLGAPRLAADPLPTAGTQHKCHATLLQHPLQGHLDSARPDAAGAAQLHDVHGLEGGLPGASACIRAGAYLRCCCQRVCTSALPILHSLRGGLPGTSACVQGNPDLQFCTGQGTPTGVLLLIFAREGRLASTPACSRVRTCISGIVRVCPPTTRNVLPGAALPGGAGPVQHQPVQGSVAEVLNDGNGDGCTWAPVLPEGGHVGGKGPSHRRQTEAAGDGPHLQRAQGRQAQA